MIPGAGPARYTARAIKATGLLEETLILLRAWRPGEPPVDLLRRARDEGLLGKATAARAEDVVSRVFNHRFLDAPLPAASSVRVLLLKRGVGPWFKDICLLQSARADVVVREAVTVFLSGLRQEGRLMLDTATMQDFLRGQENAGRMERPWSPTVVRRVAQHVLGQLTDYGALSTPRRHGVRTVMDYRPTMIALAWLAYDLHFKGWTDPEVISHPDWAVFQLSLGEVRDTLLHLAGPGLWDLQIAGSVTQFSWACSTMEEAIDAIARLDVP